MEMITFKKLKMEVNKDGITWFIFSFACLLFIVGMNMNFAAVSYNQRMPVLTAQGEDFETAMHFSFHDFSEVKYPYFADIFYLPMGLWFSLGDIYIYIGIVIILILTSINLYKVYILYKNRNKKKGKRK